MKQIIVTIALIILGVFIANTLILGDTTGNSMKSGAETIATNMISEISKINFSD